MEPRDGDVGQAAQSIPGLKVASAPRCHWNGPWGSPTLGLSPCIWEQIPKCLWASCFPTGETGQFPVSFSEGIDEKKWIVGVVCLESLGRRALGKLTGFLPS